MSSPKFLPIFCHNLSGYDAHIIVKELGYDGKDIEVIPNLEEKYISFSKIINEKLMLRFLDSFRFMPSSLDSLSKNLTHFLETSKFIPSNLMHLVKRKGIFPYEYVSNWETLNETSYSRQVWDAFSCKTLGEYSDIYLKIDVPLLADVFENFRNVTINSHKLEPAHYFTLPG
ncbi:hypothetical protein O3M35_000779 [Rhynocoris fuscipes]|uniref:DNA-directed DNA polymerase n=1 Tax=Rhynocoris fuscipes TaxID=488301 RepID=A0AAW1DMT4_9HEMI